MKKLIAFDLDDTLVVTKSALSDKMSELLGLLLEKYDVCVISGGKFELFEQNIIKRLEVPTHLLSKLHLMPTCGTRYYRFDELKEEWALQYANDLSQEQKVEIFAALESSAKELGIWCDTPKGDLIEDRLSQITHSALGQLATPDEKYAWAEEFKEIRYIYRDKVAQKIPHLEVRVSGTTSTDVTLPGIDKGYGMRKLCEAIEISRDEILFIGDKLEEGGNDYPVKALGIDTVAVEKWQDTAFVVEGILAVS